MLTKTETKLKEGYVMRPVTTKDVQVVVDLANAVSQAVFGINEIDVAELENFWGTPGLDLENDVRIIFAPNGDVAGYVEALTINDPPVHPFLWLRIHPAHGDTGVGETLLAWAMQRASRVLETVSQELRVSVQSFPPSGDLLTKKVYEDFGFTLIRHSFNMEVDFKSAPNEPVWPEGISLQPFNPAKHAEAVYRANDEAFSDHFGYLDQPFAEGFARFKHQMIDDKDAFDPGLWFIAMDGEEIAGHSICRINKQDEHPMGWVSILGVRKAWRKRGLGMALLKQSFAEFYKRGLGKAGLSVDASNLTGALKLYERAGMHAAQQYDRYEKELRPGKELMTTEVSE
jgi:mycothiol synthase